MTYNDDIARQSGEMPEFAHIDTRDAQRGLHNEWRQTSRNPLTDIVLSAKLYPAAFTDTESAILRTISAAQVWNPRAIDLNMEQHCALVSLRHAGYVELATYGYRIKGNPYTVARASEPDAIDFTGAARISVSASSHRAMIVWRDGRKPTEFAEGSADYERVVAYGKAHGTPTVWRMQGTISYVFGKIAS